MIDCHFLNIRYKITFSTKKKNEGNERREIRKDNNI
jgi:hypothetical protein